MNELLSEPINKSRAKKLFAIIMLLFCLLPVIINCFALVPLYVTLSADTAFDSSPIPVIIKYVQDFFDLCAFSVSYALIIFSLLLLSKKDSRFVILLYSLAFLSKIPMTLLMNVFLYGTLGNSTEIIFDIVYLGVYFALAMLQLLLVYLFSSSDANKYLRSVAFINERNGKALKEKKKGGKKNSGKQDGIVKLSPVLPFSKFASRYNPLQRSAMKMGALVCAVKIFSRILNDISFGAPQSFGEILVMVVYYLSDLLYGVIAYIIALLVFTAVYDRLRKSKKLEDSETANEKTDEEKSPSVLGD